MLVKMKPSLQCARMENICRGREMLLLRGVELGPSSRNETNTISGAIR